MATDGPDPKPCDGEIYRRGTVVGIFETYGANHFEDLIRQVREQCGQRVDWHYAGGRAIVKALGDVDAARAAVDRIVKPVIAQKREEFLSELHRRPNT